MPDGYYDGPRAWGLVLHWCTHGQSDSVAHSLARDGQRDESGVGVTEAESVGVAPESVLRIVSWPGVEGDDGLSDTTADVGGATRRRQ